jgi:ketopantoate reductase
MAHDVVMPRLGWSMGRAIEVDEVFGDLVDRAERSGVAVPRLRLVGDLLRGMDPGRHAG